MSVPFEKMQGSGNDFVMIDNRANLVDITDQVALSKRVCPRATAVGADGVIFLENDDELDFSWNFYNADGSVAEMCGNGARCMAVFAHQVGAAGRSMAFRTLAGPVEATLVADGARVKLPDCSPLQLFSELPLANGTSPVYFANTGVPHAILPVKDLEAVQILEVGAEVRYHAQFSPAGTNVNFIALTGESEVSVRTYERGVEGETLACGTGAVASALVASEIFGLASPVAIRTRSGVILTISFASAADGFVDLFLEGPVCHVYSGILP